MYPIHSSMFLNRLTILLPCHLLPIFFIQILCAECINVCKSDGKFFYCACIYIFTSSGSDLLLLLLSVILLWMLSDWNVLWHVNVVGNFIMAVKKIQVFLGMKRLLRVPTRVIRIKAYYKYF